MLVELTRFTKADGPLTKRISISPLGTVESDGSACLMARGTAQRLRIADMGELGSVIEKIPDEQAIALGALRNDLPEEVQVVARHKLNGQQNTIARTAANIRFYNKKPAVALLDYDTKGMPPEIAAEIKRHGGFWPALLSVMPTLRPVAHLIRRSTSAGLFRTDTGGTGRVSPDSKYSRVSRNVDVYFHCQRFWRWTSASGTDLVFLLR